MPRPCLTHFKNSLLLKDKNLVAVGRLKPTFSNVQTNWNKLITYKKVKTITHLRFFFFLFQIGETVFLITSIVSTDGKCWAGILRPQPNFSNETEAWRSVSGWRTWQEYAGEPRSSSVKDASLYLTASIHCSGEFHFWAHRVRHLVAEGVPLAPCAIHFSTVFSRVQSSWAACGDTYFCGSRDVLIHSISVPFSISYSQSFHKSIIFVTYTTTYTLFCIRKSKLFQAKSYYAQIRAVSPYN